MHCLSRKKKPTHLESVTDTPGSIILENANFNKFCLVWFLYTVYQCMRVYQFDQSILNLLIIVIKTKLNLNISTTVLIIMFKKMKYNTGII